MPSSRLKFVVILINSPTRIKMTVVEIGLNIQNFKKSVKAQDHTQNHPKDDS
jgi:hypothetical protein